MRCEIRGQQCELIPKTIRKMGLSCSSCYQRKRKCDKPLYGSCTRCIKMGLTECIVGWQQSIKLKRVNNICTLYENDKQIYNLILISEGDYDPIEFNF